MRIIAVIIFLTVFIPAVFGQSNSKVKEQAEQTAKALLDGDYETLMKFTHPRVVEIVGGKEKMISLITKGKEEMKAQGIGFESVTIGEPTETVNAGDEIHCIISQTIIMTVPNGKLRSKGYLLAVSRDKGESWQFIDTAQLNMDNVKKVLPDYNPALEIPKAAPPEFIENQE